ncbi:transmembrane protein 225B isoform X1 [Pteropus vampyrus]|uniref:Transmembrane protein 225B isoform X1 n=1 Tax=Pteropus vampyrus TaxID=132908 RepID=A0A6P6C492_PTEVA|nr:transmembrane protein 225B isoform X1 [Pteropus vampyrus]
MGRPVMLTLEDDDMKGYTWAIAPALTALGYLLIVLVAIFPFWVRLVNEESREVFFSGLFENCFHIKCWKPRPLSIYIILGRVFLLSAVVLSFLTTLMMVSFASQLFPRTRKHNFVSAFISFLTGACAFLALLLHALEIQSLRMKPSPPQFSVQWPYYILGLGTLLFIVAVYSFSCQWMLDGFQFIFSTTNNTVNFLVYVSFCTCARGSPRCHVLDLLDPDYAYFQVFYMVPNRFPKRWYHLPLSRNSLL